MSAPQSFAIAPAVCTNLSVHIVAEGIPCFSECIPSCTLHALHDPQSPMAMMMASEASVRDFRSTGSAGLEALGFFNKDTFLTSYFSVLSFKSGFQRGP